MNRGTYHTAVVHTFKSHMIVFAIFTEDKGLSVRSGMHVAPR